MFCTGMIGKLLRKKDLICRWSFNNLNFQIIEIAWLFQVNSY